MKGIIKIAVTAAVIAGVTAQPHNHQHRHRHVKKHNQSPVEERDGNGAVVVTQVVQGPTVVEYVLEGQPVDATQAEQGISEGRYVVLGSSRPTFTPPPISSSTSIVVSTSMGAQFIEQKTTSSSTTSTTSTTSSAAPTTTSAAPSTSSAAPSAAPAGGSIDQDFPSGKLPCANVPTAYGAVKVPWVGTSGWTSLQQIGTWTAGVAVSNIVAPTSGTCQPGMMCSYACPAGYQKSQWPETSQGSTGQSIGGLWCNSDGFLELTRPSHPKICEPGAGGVYIKNEMSGSAAVCRTDYPGSEAMVIPLNTTPGNTYPLTNPVSSDYYVWEGKSTTAQYYVNPLNVAVEDACVWTSPTNPDSAGNWAPTNIGVGQDDSGITYISIFPNLPTSNAELDFDIEITGDVSGSCSLTNGQYSQSNGCTVGVQAGGTATIVFKASGSS